MTVQRPERLTGWELAESQTVPSPGLVLTPEQEHAIARRSEPLSLAAGAGSGKTSVLVERYVRAIYEDGVAPERILAITFTERAAAELQERVQARLLDLSRPETGRASGRAYVGTFHGFCARILRAHAREAGLAEEYEILDEGLAARLRRRAFAEALGEFVGGEREEAVDLIAAYGADRARAIVLGAYAQLRSRGRRIPRLPAPELDRRRVPAVGQEPLSSQSELEAQRALDVQGARSVALWDELLERFGRRYEAAKQERSGVDFDDLELYAVELLTADMGVRRKWSEQLDLLMVDELQDVNPRQLALLRALERDNLFTVGDAWQSIYGFRHADVSLFRAREAQLAPLGRSLRLTHNFRGRSELLQAVNAVFVTRFGGAFTPLHAGRETDREREAHHEPLIELLLTDRRGWSADLRHAPVTGAPVSAGQAGGDPGVSDPGSDAGGRLGSAGGRLGSAGGGLGSGAGGGLGSGADADPGVALWREAEACALAERIAQLVHAGQVSPGGVAVLLRGTSDIECYERALRRQGISTIAAGGSFWTRQEVVDLLTYLRALIDPADELALYGVLSAPPVSLSSDQLALLARAARERECSVWEVIREGDAGLAGMDHGLPGVASGHSGVASGLPGVTGSLPGVTGGLPGRAGGHSGVASGRSGVASGPGAGRNVPADTGIEEEYQRAAELCAWLERERALADQLPISQLLERALEHGGRLERLSEGEGRQRRLANVRKLLETARRWERTEGHDLRGLLEEAAFQAGTGRLGGRPSGAEVVSEPDAPLPDEAGDAVRLMSVHAAKGLEFDVVCIADLGRTPSMSVPDLLTDGERIGVRLLDLADPEPRPALQYSELARERREAQAEEEDRIVYVAMTRARERLLLSGAVDFVAWPRERPGAPPISWLAPALASEVPILCAEAGKGRIAEAGKGRIAEAERGRIVPPPLTVDGTDVPLGLRLNTARGTVGNSADRHGHHKTGSDANDAAGSAGSGMSGSGIVGDDAAGEDAAGGDSAGGDAAGGDSAGGDAAGGDAAGNSV